MNFVSLESQCFPRLRLGKLRFEGNKIHGSPRYQSLSDLFDIVKQMGQTGGKQIITLLTNDFIETAVNISRITVNCFLFYDIVFVMLPARGIWRETVSLVDVM